jgi:hypothetical protein
VNTLLIQDTFEPYYAGRPGFASPDMTKRRKSAKAAAGEGHGDAEGSDRDAVDGPASQPKAALPEH